MSGDAALCDRGGLLDTRLEACRAAAAAGTVETTDGPITVTVARQ